MARILVIDDESNIRMMVRLALQHDGHTIETAPDGPEGLTRFGDGQGWDLILLDQRMPGMDGLEVLREVKRRAPATRIIMITAYGTIDLAVEAMKAGAMDFLRKPFSTDVLRNAVQASLQRNTADLLVPSHSGTKAEGVPSIPAPIGMTTLNGFRIEEPTDLQGVDAARSTYRFTVRNPSGEARSCAVHLPSYVADEVKAHAGHGEIPGGEQFWQALCEEVLANYIWQHSDLPPHATLEIEDLTTGLRRWINSVLAA